MRIYDARQNDNGFWEWSYTWGNNKYLAGACAEGRCRHASKEDALEHESIRIREIIKSSPTTRTPYPYPVKCRYCDKDAIYCIYEPEIGLFNLCAHHTYNPEFKIQPHEVSY